MSKNNNPMDNENKNLTPEQELEATQALNEEEVRDTIISEYGFNEDDDAERIDKMVEKEMDNAKKLSSAIGQKIKQREKVKELEIQLGEKKETPPTKTEVKTDDDLDKKLNERFEKKELDNLEYSDELKDEIQKVAKLQNISIKQALRDPYIAFKLEEYGNEQKADEASISRTNNKTGKQKYSFDNPPDPDMDTPEGRKEWDDYNKQMIKEGY